MTARVLVVDDILANVKLLEARFQWPAMPDRSLCDEDQDEQPHNETQGAKRLTVL